MCELQRSSDIVVVRVPRGLLALPVMRVVISGVTAHHRLALDHLDDLQLAIENIMAEEPDQGGELELRVWMAEDAVHVRIDGLTNQRVRKALTAAEPDEPSDASLLDMRLFLPSLADGYRVVGESSHSYGIELEKRAS